MHANEIKTSVEVIKRLLDEQFPHWAELPIKPVSSAGTDNALYRLGDDMVVRMPRINWAIEQVERDHQWLPRLAPGLPLKIPTPLAIGRPGAGYSWNWAIHRWLPGENATLDRLSDAGQAAADLAGFVTALRKVDTTGAPPASRGVPLVTRDAQTRKAIKAVQNDFDARALHAAWDAALAQPAWDRPPEWVHGDLQSGNLLAVAGKLQAVIDFGMSGIGDPACDMMVAWNLFPRDAREVYRKSTAVDDAAWARGRGWALSVSLLALPYYRTTNPVLAGISRHTIEQVLSEAAFK